MAQQFRLDQVPTADTAPKPPASTPTPSSFRCFWGDGQYGHYLAIAKGEGRPKFVSMEFSELPGLLEAIRTAKINVPRPTETPKTSNFVACESNISDVVKSLLNAAEAGMHKCSINPADVRLEK